MFSGCKPHTVSLACIIFASDSCERHFTPGHQKKSYSFCTLLNNKKKTQKKKTCRQLKRQLEVDRTTGTSKWPRRRPPQIDRSTPSPTEKTPPLDGEFSRDAQAWSGVHRSSHRFNRCGTLLRKIPSATSNSPSGTMKRSMSTPWPPR